MTDVTLLEDGFIRLVYERLQFRLKTVVGFQNGFTLGCEFRTSAAFTSRCCDNERTPDFFVHFTNPCPGGSIRNPHAAGRRGDRSRSVNLLEKICTAGAQQGSSVHLNPGLGLYGSFMFAGFESCGSGLSGLRHQSPGRKYYSINSIRKYQKLESNNKLNIETKGGR